MSVSALNEFGPRGWIFFSTSMTEYLTSALVNGLPSWNFTPWRSLKVTLSPSALTCHDSARLGCGLSSRSYSSRPS